MDERYQALSEVLTEACAGLGRSGQLVLQEAFDQSATGKGAERHSEGESLVWTDQPIFAIPDILQGDGFLLGQAMKKLHEQRGLPLEMARAECLGAIVYLSAAVARLNRTEGVRTEVSSLIADAGSEVHRLIECIARANASEMDPAGKRAFLVDVIAAIGNYVASKDQLDGE